MSGPNEITCRPARPLPEAPEEAIAQAAGTTAQVGARERVRDESIRDGLVLESEGAVVHGIEVFGGFEATTVGAAGAGAVAVALPLAAGALCLEMIVHADEEIERRGEVYAGARMLGALVVLEGRSRGPEVQRLRAALAAHDDHDSLARLRGFQDGMEAAERWIDHAKRLTLKITY